MPFLCIGILLYLGVISLCRVIKVVGLCFCSNIAIHVNPQIMDNNANKNSSPKVLPFTAMISLLVFSYIIEQDVCFLTLCDRNFNKKLAYSFLEDLSQEFYGQFEHKINVATRPYSFIEFGKSLMPINWGCTWDLA